MLNQNDLVKRICGFSSCAIFIEQDDGAQWAHVGEFRSDPCSSCDAALADLLQKLRKHWFELKKGERE